MNAALSNVFLSNLPKAICERYKPICMKQPNTIFLHMFDWFINKYSKTTTKDCKENRQKMAANWHPYDGLEPLAMLLFVGASYASVAHYPMNNRNIIDIRLREIKWCGMHCEEYKNWIAHERKIPAIVETIDSFKEYWARAITLINQTSILATQHGYGMTAMDDNTLHVLYSKPLKTLARPMLPRRKDQDPSDQHGRYARPTEEHPAILHGCHQQPPPTSYALTQQQHMSNNRRGRRNGGGHD